MRYLILINTIFPQTLPTSKIVKRFIKNSFDKNDEITVISKLNDWKNKPIKEEENVKYVFINNYSKMKGSLFFDLVVLTLKCFKRILKSDKLRDLLDSKILYKAIKKEYSAKPFDKIIVFSGEFISQRCAAKFCKKNKLKYIAFYADPFTGNTTYHVPFKKSIKIEKKWLEHCDIVMMPSNYIKWYKLFFPMYQDKFKEIELPCYDEFNNVKEVDNFLIVHSGTFYHALRPIESLYKISEILKDTKYKIVNLSLKPKKFDQSKYQNICFKIEKGESYLNTLASSGCLLLIDNFEGFQIPSKTFEYVISNKKIIFVYKNPNSETYNLIKNMDGILLTNIEQINKEEIINFLQLNIGIKRTLPLQYRTQNIYECFKKYIKETL